MKYLERSKGGATAHRKFFASRSSATIIDCSATVRVLLKKIVYATLREQHYIIDSI